MGMSITAKSKILKGMLGKENYATLASTAYIGLFTSEPTYVSSSGGYNYNEPDTTKGYGRTFLGNYSNQAGQLMAIDSADGHAYNSAIIYFPEATDSWGEITHFGIFANPTGGDPILWGALTTPITVPANYVPLFRVSALTIAFE